MKILITGGRKYRDRQAIFESLDRVHETRGITLLIHGACRTGADAIAEEWAKAREVPYLGHPARWTANGLAAGPMRNQDMLDWWEPEGVIAFPGGDGTADMIQRARNAGLKVWEPFRL